MSRTGTKNASIRWSQHMVALEFDIDDHTVGKKLRAINAIPADDGCFSTKQIIEALFGDQDVELVRARIKDTNASAFMKEMKADNLLRNNIPAAMVEKVWADYIRDLKEKIQQSSLSLGERNELLKDLGSIPVDKYFEDLKNEEASDEKEVD
jgi:hypothetical protein